jgi:hypothetical protein
MAGRTESNFGLNERAEMLVGEATPRESERTAGDWEKMPLRDYHFESGRVLKNIFK